jgi:hypothetical protein
VFLKLKNNKWLLIFKIIKKKLLKILTFFAVRIYILMGWSVRASRALPPILTALLNLYYY